MNNDRILLGTGVFSWSRYERIGDRYGTVYIMTEYQRESKELPLVVENDGKKGQLIAIPIQTRESGHIGDFFSGHSPSTPEIGEEILLGSGTLFSYIEDGWFHTGLEPDDGRQYNWLDPKAMYRAHDQTVELYFEEVQ